MREIDLNNLSTKDLADYPVIAAAFKKYLMDILYYDEYEANFVVASDFENPYNTPFIVQDYEGVYEVDGKKYEIRFCRTDFCTVGLYHLASEPQFEFYMLFDLETLPNNNVGSYQNAKKLYVI